VYQGEGGARVGRYARREMKWAWRVLLGGEAPTAAGDGLLVVAAAADVDAKSEYEKSGQDPHACRINPRIPFAGSAAGRR
jgi:hypothetical protein